MLALFRGSASTCYELKLRVRLDVLSLTLHSNGHANIYNATALTISLLLSTHS